MLDQIARGHRHFAVIRIGELARGAMEVDGQLAGGLGVEMTLPSGDVQTVEPGRTVRAPLSVPPGTSLLPLAVAGDAAPGLIRVRLYEDGIDALREAADGVAIQP